MTTYNECDSCSERKESVPDVDNIIDPDTGAGLARYCAECLKMHQDGSLRHHPNYECQCGWIHGSDDEGCKRWHDGLRQGREQAFRFMHEHISSQMDIMDQSMPPAWVLHMLSKVAKDMEKREPGCWDSFLRWVEDRHECGSV